MARVNVEIVTPEKRVAQTQVDEAIIPGGNGLFGVRPGHTPFLSVMEPGPLTLKDGAKTETWFVAGGFVQVSNDRVLVLADHAEPASGIDVDAARKRMDAALARMKGMSAADPQFDLEQAIVKSETARIAVAAR
ncbi:MAG: F0F1 ATP synthase subunit epsilon [Myxococcaceae bacterium]